MGETDGSTDGFLVMTGGEIELNESSGGNSPHAYGIDLYGTSTATLSGGVLDVNEIDRGSATGLRAYDSSTFTMTAGSVFSVDEADNNDLVGFRAEENSVVEIRGGTIDLTESGGGSLTTFVAADNSRVDIYGGTFDLSWTSRPSHYIGFRSNDNALVTIYGSSFNYPYGSVAASTGTITGTLSDDSPFSLKFDRSGGGGILLAPPLPLR